MYPDDLVIEPAKIARRLGVKDPSPDQLEMIEDVIRDCQADVADFLNRDSLFAVDRTLTGIAPRYGYELTDWQAWPQAQDMYDDRYAVVGDPIANPDGTFDVTFKVGLDGPNEDAIVRYVKAHAMQTILNDANAAMGKRQITSISAEGQSVSYSDGSVADGAAGSLPPVTTLKRYKRLSAHRGARGSVSIWPLTGVGYSDRR